MSPSVTVSHVGVVLFYFVQAFLGEGARGWVVDNAGQRISNDNEP